MKIGILTEIINYHSGARAPLMIGKQLAAFGHTVIVFAYDTLVDQSTITDFKKNKVQIVLIKKRHIPYVGKYLSCVSVYKQIKHHAPNAMWYSGTLPFFLAAYVTGIPIIRMYQGTQFNAFLENK